MFNMPRSHALRGECHKKLRPEDEIFQIVLLTEPISLIWQYDPTFLMLDCTGSLAPVT